MNTIRYLTNHQHEVTLFFPSRSRVDPDVLAHLRQYCVRVEHFYVAPGDQVANVVSHPLLPLRTSRRLHRGMQREVDLTVGSGSIDAILVEHQNMAAYLKPAYLRQAKCVVRFQSLAYKAYFRTAAHTRPGLQKVVNIMQGFASRHFEQGLLTHPPFHEAWFLLEADLAEATTVAPETAAKARVLPIGIAPRQQRDPSHVAELAPFKIDDRVILFVGSMSNPTNEDGARWLATAILPRVRASVPRARLCIVGRNADAMLSDLRSDSVVVVANAPDLTPYLERADVYAVAERGEQGIHVSGIHMKLLDGLSAGKVIVASPVGTGGIDVLKEGVHYLAAHNEDEFVQRIVDVLTQPLAYLKIATAALALFHDHFSADAAGRAVEERLLLLTADSATARKRGR